MRKLTFISAIILLSIAAYAQLPKGDFLMSVQGNGSFSGKHNIQVSAFTLQTGAYKLVRNNLALGMNFTADFEGSNLPGYLNGDVINRRRAYTLEAGPVLRKYFGSNKLKPYAELGISAGYNYQRVNGENSYTHDNIDLYIRPALGLSYWFTDNVSFDVNVNSDINHGHSLFYYNDLNLNLGFTVKLGK